MNELFDGWLLSESRLHFGGLSLPSPFFGALGLCVV